VEARPLEQAEEVPVFRPGRRFFSAASLALLLVALLHALGHVSPPPENAGRRAVRAVMEAYHFDAGLGMRPSAQDVLDSLSLTMSIALAWLGILNLIAARDQETSWRLIDRLALLGAVAAFALVVVYAVFRVFPPLLSLAVVDGLFVLALVVPTPRSASDG
jgi:hypothetical protein